MSEWSKEHDWKSCVRLRVPRVRIPPSPPPYALRASGGKPPERGRARSVLPAKLKSYVAVETKDKAMALEKYFKTGSGKAVATKRFL